MHAQAASVVTGAKLPTPWMRWREGQRMRGQLAEQARTARIRHALGELVRCDGSEVAAAAGTAPGPGAANRVRCRFDPGFSGVLGLFWVRSQCLGSGFRV